MKYVLGLSALLAVALLPGTASAVTKAEDIATTIMLRGQPCGGHAVSNISEVKDEAGTTVRKATCPNGTRYRIDVGANGRVSVTPIR